MGIMPKEIWTNKELKLLNSLKSPANIQQYLDSLKYNTDDIVRSPREVIKTCRAHCFDGALFAACAMDFHSEKSSLVALYSDGNDDDHVICVFKRNGYLGAVAKSNFTTLRWRNPVYKTLRELVMSYFDGYFTLSGSRSLRGYSNTLSLHSIKTEDWRTSSENLNHIGKLIDQTGKNKLLRSWMNKNWIKNEIPLADKRLIRAATIGLNKKGAF